MRVQSRPGRIHLLPALPSRWRKGSLRGLRAVGGIELDLSWEDSKVTAVRLASSLAQSVTIDVNGAQHVVQLATSVPVELAL